MGAAFARLRPTMVGMRAPVTIIRDRTIAGYIEAPDAPPVTRAAWPDSAGMAPLDPFLPGPPDDVERRDVIIIDEPTRWQTARAICAAAIVVVAAAAIGLIAFAARAAFGVPGP